MAPGRLQPRRRRRSRPPGPRRARPRRRRSRRAARRWSSRSGTGPGGVVSSAARMATRCAGVVPQQPPMIRRAAVAGQHARSRPSAPACRRSGCGRRRTSGCRRCPWRSPAAPAARPRSRARCAAGPRRRPRSWRRRRAAGAASSPTSATMSAEVRPIIVRPAVSKLIVPHQGAPVRAMPSAAARNSSGAEIVSTQSTSAPPASRPRACSSNISAASSIVSGPSGAMISPVGPIEPATTTGRPAASAASRAISAAMRLSSMHPVLGVVQLQPAGVAAEAVGEEEVAAGADRAVVEGADLAGLASRSRARAPRRPRAPC